MTRKCKQCGVVFFPNQPHQVFCNRKCTMKHYDALRIDKQRYMIEHLRKYLNGKNPTIEGVKAIVL